MAEVIVTIGSAHIRRVDRASTRRMRKMTQDAVSEACRRGRERGGVPISAVDDLSMHAAGRWITTFGKCLARSARREGISIVGGEMAQMRDTYRPQAISLVVYVVSLHG